MKILKIFFLIFVQILLILFGCSSSIKTTTPHSEILGINIDTVKAQKYDMGKMWTFENPPIHYFEKQYSFLPTDEWLTKVRKSALKFGNGCSASFISEDGLIMTNHHCIRTLLADLSNDNENFLKDGFFAEDLNDERIVPDLFVLQLISIEDVTSRIKKEMELGESSDEKIYLRDFKKQELISEALQRNDSLEYRIVSLYNGGKYSLYGYKRYNDIRLVFVPDLRTAKLGGDYDNFTYPRHGLDCAFLRAYENNEPVKTEFYFTWSDSGADEGEPVFVVGNPGKTERLSTLSQIKFDLEYKYPLLVNYYQDLYNILLEKVKETNTEDYTLIARFYSIGNSLKVYKGRLEGLTDPVFWARKADFENSFKAAVENDGSHGKKYADIWDEIERIKNETVDFISEYYSYTIILNPRLTSDYFNIAYDLIKLVSSKVINEEANIKINMDSTIAEIYPENFDKELSRKILKAEIDFLYKRLGEKDKFLDSLLNGKKGKEAAKYLIEKSVINSTKEFQELASKSSSEILNSGDPFIEIVIFALNQLRELSQKKKELDAEEEYYDQLMGEALFDVYGENIPPDATGTLRISDGVIKSYSYNGTIAPPHTTFYGMLEKYYAFNKEFPFNLPPIWENLPEGFDLKTPLDFISTNDIIGGNSGSPVINKNAEIVGLAFDGNYESLSNNYIYTTEANRTISVHSLGMIEGIRDLYKAKRLSEEILKGKITK